MGKKTTDTDAPVRSLPPLWRYWSVRWEFMSNVYASVPADPEVIKAWLDARKPKVRPPGGRSMDEVNEEVLTSLAEQERADENAVLLVFQYAEMDGARVICVRAETIRAHMKDCARVLSAQYMGRIDGERAFSTKIINGAYPSPRRRWIEVRRETGETITKPDNETDRFVHPRFGGSALKRLQILEPPVFVEFTLQTLGDSIKATDLEKLFAYGGVHGYGGERSLDGGRYLATCTEVGDGRGQD